MAFMMDAHQQALATATILEERMERMSQSTSHHCSSSCSHSGSCQCSNSHQCRRSRSLGHQEVDPQVTSHCWETEARLEDPQADSHQGGKMDIDFHQWVPWAIPYQRGATQGHTQSPSPTRQKCQVTFTNGRGHLLTEESPEHNARADEGYQLPPPMWQTEEAPHKEANWSRPREEAGTIPVKGDEDLESPPPLEPHLEQLLAEKEPSLVSAEVGDAPLPH